MGGGQVRGARKAQTITQTQEHVGDDGNIQESESVTIEELQGEMCRI